MINNDTMRHALGSLERYAPAEDAVLAGFRQGVVRRRRHRQVASVVGVAGAASLVALGVVLVSPGDQGPGPQQGNVAAPPTSTSVKIATPPAPPALPFTVSGLPAGYQLDSWEVSPNEGSAQYGGNKDFQTIVVWISDKPRDPIMDGDTEEATTVAGRPGTIRRLAPDRAEQQLIWQVADGRWILVGGRAPTVSLAALRTVAESLTLEPTPLEVPFSLSVLPDGYQVASWNGGGRGPLGGSVLLCRTTVNPRDGEQKPPDCVSAATHEGTAPATTQRKTGKPNDVVEVPIDQAKVVNGISTRATADGTEVVAQIDAGHWVSVYSMSAGADLLRELASTIGIK